MSNTRTAPDGDLTNTASLLAVGALGIAATCWLAAKATLVLTTGTSPSTSFAGRPPSSCT